MAAITKMAMTAEMTGWAGMGPPYWAILIQ